MSSNSSASTKSPESKNIRMDDEELFTSESEGPTLDLIYRTLMELKRDIKIVRQENEEKRQEFEEIKKSVEFQSGEIEDLKRENDKLKKGCHEQEEVIKNLKQEVSVIEF